MPPRRRRGFGFVRRLPSGKWQASYVGPDLARHNAPSTFLTKGDAEGWLGVQRQLITSGHRGSTSSGAPESAAIPVLSAYSTQWLADRELKPRTREGYEHLLRRYIAPRARCLSAGPGHARSGTGVVEPTPKTASDRAR